MNTTDANHAANKLPASNGRPPSAADSQLLQTLLAQSHGDTPSGPPALSTTPTISGLLQALRRRWPLAIVVALSAAALTVMAVFEIMPPMYVVSVRLRVAAKQVGPDDVEFPIFKANMEWLVKSPLVLNNALNSRLADGREVKDLDLVRSKGMGAAEWLEKSLKTEYVNGAPEVLRVSLTADNAEEGAEILNAICAAFLKEVEGVEKKKKQDRLVELKNIMETKEDEKRRLHGLLVGQMDALKVQGTEAIRSESERVGQELTGTKGRKSLNDEEIAKYESEVNTIQDRLKKLDTLPPSDSYVEEALSKDEAVIEYMKEINKIDLAIVEYSRLLEPYRSKYINDKKIDREQVVQLIKRRGSERLPDLTRNYRNSERLALEKELSKASAKLQAHKDNGANLLKEVQDLENRRKELAGTRVPAQIQAIEMKIDLTLKDVERTAEKIRDVHLETPSARVAPMERAAPPLQKDITRQTRIAGAGGIGMFGLALFGVAFLEFRSRKISMPADLTHGLGLNVIGTVPALPTRWRKGSGRGATQEQWQHQLHESIDAIRTVLLHHARGSGLRVILVTSANSGEGKTTLATQLAASLARAWKRTLIIDGDLRNPATHELFEVPREPGLAEVLRGEVEVADATRATAFSRLWILPAGHGDGHAIQALAQESVRAIFESLKQQYDFIIVDSPPVLPVTDSLLIGQHADGVLLSILRDVSRAPAVYAAQQKLAPLGVHTLGAVVLGAQPEFGNNNYRYAMMPSK